MFLLVGLMYEKAHTRYIPDLGGLATRMPVLAAAFLLTGLASLGLPGTSGFVSEVLVFLGAFPVWSWLTGAAAFGIVVTAGYILWMVQRTLFGPVKERFDSVRDATKLEMVPLLVLIVAIIAVGVYPAFITDAFTEGVGPIVQAIQAAQDQTLLVLK
jgi:NADH-quinone oxidoreductase subunit M